MQPKVAVVIPNWNTQRWLSGCLDGLRVQTFQNFQTILVDNGSTDNSVDFVREYYPEVEILSFPKNRGFAAAVNAGINHTCSEYVALLNVDTVPDPNWLSSLVKVMEQCPPEVGSAASKMLSFDNPKLVDDAGNTLSWYGSAHKRGLREPAENYTRQEEVFSPSGGATLHRREFLEDVGYFDEHFVSYLEDVDLGLRGRMLGYRYVYVPTSKVLHKWQGASIPRPKYVYLCTRNRLILLLKNIPWQLLFKHIHTLLYGQLYFFIVYKKPLYSLIGYGSVLLDLPRILHQRRIIQKRKTVSNQALDAMFSHDLSEPPLKQIIKSRLK